MAKVFVIDDDPKLLRMVGLMLERGGHTSVLVEDPIQAFSRLEEERPDILVLDIMMPNMSGYDFARRVRKTESLADIPILVLSARSQEIDRVTAFKSGADDYMSKPVTTKELVDRIDDLLLNKGDRMMMAQGLVIALYGLRGGVGQTTTAVNLALALNQVTRQTVCLCDLSPASSQAATHLRLKLRSTWENLPAAGQLDWSILQNRLTVHESGLRVLASPVTPQLPIMPSAEMTSTMLSLLRNQIAFTIVDLPPVLNPAFKATLSTADLALHILSPDLVAVQSAVQLNRALKSMGINSKQRAYVLNQVSAEAPLPRKAVERGLNTRVTFHVGFDPYQAGALSQGVPQMIASEISPISQVTRNIAQVIWERVLAT